MEIDDWTLHCVNCRVKELLSFNEKMRDDALQRQNEVEYLIFEGRILVLVELQTKIKELKIPSIDWEKQYGDTDETNENKRMC